MSKYFRHFENTKNKKRGERPTLTTINQTSILGVDCLRRENKGGIRGERPTLTTINQTSILGVDCLRRENKGGIRGASTSDGSSSSIRSNN
ncbi:hypothetical protein QE152_g9 [Popillia japonica]|uniref:Uncharacterized protein n=1 Tax=Popillia japonica TaxID=7064 RepID=A0AAW1NKL0_POPJA